MRATFKNGVLVDNEGFELYPNKVYIYGAGFKKLTKYLQEGTEVELTNVWDQHTLYADNAKVLYGGCITLNVVNAPKTVPEPDEQEVIINDPNVPFPGKKGCGNNGVQRCDTSDKSGGLSSDMHDSSIQDESNDAEGVQGLNIEQHESN